MTLGDRLAHVCWLGGSPCSGKSTIADSLAARFGMIVYRCDDRYFDHIETVTPEDHPVFHQIAHATADQIWLRPVEQQISEEIALYGEELPMILDNLLSLPPDRPVIAEGAALMPTLLRPLGLRHHRTVWMVPTEEFQRLNYEERAWRHEVLRECSDPDRAWENWMNRDAGFAREVIRQATATGSHLIITDGLRSIDDIETELCSHFALSAL